MMYRPRPPPEDFGARRVSGDALLAGAVVVEVNVRQSGVGRNTGWPAPESGPPVPCVEETLAVQPAQPFESAAYRNLNDASSVWSVPSTSVPVTAT